MNIAPTQALSTMRPLRAVLDPAFSEGTSGDLARSATNTLRVFLSVSLVAVSYYLGVRLGFALAPPGSPISVIWPANAILLAAFLISPIDRWWLLVIAVLPAHLLVQLPRGIPVTTSLGWFFGNTGEGLLGAYLITSIQDVRDSFERVRGLLVFVAFGVVGAPLVTSFLDVGVVIATGWGQDFWHLWAVRQFSNMLGELTVAPPIILFCIHRAEWFKKATWTKYVEAALLAVAVIAVAIYALESTLSNEAQIHFFYIVLILLSWATLRFDFAGLSIMLLATSLISSLAVVHGRAPYLASPENVMPLHIFLFMVALPSMFIAVVLIQQEETAKSLRESKVRLVNSQEQERFRIARELHDGVGQSLALVQIQLSQLEDECGVELKSKLEHVQGQVADISHATHEISHGLHPSHLEFLGLSAALRKLCADIGKEHSLHIDFHESNVPEHLQSAVSLSLYRIAQEALHNAAKYSRAHRVKVRLRGKSGRLWLEIDDDGIGFAKKDNSEAGLGLLNMQERMESIGGTLFIRSAPGAGTHVHASLRLGNAA